MEIKHRYAYIKNGDVILQLKSLIKNPAAIPSGGPNAFIADFLSHVGDCPLLLISSQKYSDYYRHRNIRAYVMRMSIPALGAMGAAVARTLSFGGILLHLARFKPTRALCGSLGYPLWVAFIYSKLFSVPLVFSLHNRLEYSGHGPRKRLIAKINKYILRRVNTAICHGPYLRQQLLDIGIPEHRIKEFDCGLKDLWERPGANDNAPAHGDNHYKSITYIGRIDYTKGVFDLLEACRELLESCADIRLVYVGGGYDLNGLKDRISILSLGNRVVLRGTLGRDELAGVIRNSYIVVTPTKSCFPEGRCMAAMEGLAMGIPVIAPAFGPFPYLVKDRINGLLFIPDSVPDLRKKIHELVHDRVLYTRLRQGAQQAGKEILEPATTFYQAVQWAFNAYPRI